jgi:hypothetical protein
MLDGVGLRPAFTQVSRDHGPKMVHPAANGPFEVPRGQTAVRQKRGSPATIGLM